MAAIRFTAIAVAILATAQVNGYPANNPVANLPIDCPFHREPLGTDHIGNTIIGTLTQDGNYKFSKIPGQFLQSLQDYAQLAQNNPLTSQEQEYPDFPNNYEQNDSEFEPNNNYYTQEFPEFNHQYPEFDYQGEEYNDSFEYNSENGNHNEDGFASILPYFGDQNQNLYDYQFPSGQFNYGDHNTEFDGHFGFNNEESEESEDSGEELEGEENENYFSILPYPNNEQFSPETKIENKNQNSEQENNFVYIAQLIQKTQSKHDDIYNGAIEEINEASETGESKIAAARAKAGGQPVANLGKNIGNQGLTRSFLSRFSPQNLIAAPLKIATATVLTPLNVVSNVVTQTVANRQAAVVPKEVAAKKPEVAAKKPEVAAKKPEVAAKKPEVAAKKPEVKNVQTVTAAIIPSSVANSGASSVCKTEVTTKLNKNLAQNDKETQQCITNAEDKFKKALNLARNNMDQTKIVNEGKKNQAAEKLVMCGQSKKCPEEENSLKETNTDFATEVNTILAQVTGAEDALTPDLKICEANSETRQEIMRDEAKASNANC